MRMWAAATASWSSAAKASASALRAAATSTSPPRTYSIAGSGKAGVSWATEARRTFDGMSRSPTSGSSSPFSAANRVDLPQPLRPMTPRLQPVWIVRSICDNKVRLPRRRARLRNEIMDRHAGDRRLRMIAVPLHPRRRNATQHTSAGRFWKICQDHGVTTFYTAPDRHSRSDEARATPSRRNTIFRSCGCSGVSASRSTRKRGSGTSARSATSAAR